MSKKRRVAIVSQSVNDGGVNTVIERIYDCLAASNRYEPTVISLALSSRDAASVRLMKPSQWREGVRSRTVKWRGMDIEHFGARWVELEFMRYQPRAILTKALQPFDLIQVVAGSAVTANALRQLKQPICITTATMLAPERRALLASAPPARRLWLTTMTRIAERYERAALENAAHVFAISQYTYDMMCRATNPDKVSLAPTGIDTTFFHPADSYATDGHLIAVGRWDDARKNVRMLFRAFRQICDELPQQRLILVGQNPPSGEDWAVAEELGIAERVDVRVAVSSAELRHLYQTAALFLLTSDEEGQGIVILEAMACGVPAISTRCGGPEMMIESDVNGYLVPKGNVDAFAAQAIASLNDTAHRQTMSQHARQSVERCYSTTAMARRYLRVYDALLA